MVKYTDSTHLLPGWVHEFWQWHFDMFDSLEELCQEEEVFQGGSWVVQSHHDCKWLDPRFKVPQAPILVPVPPEHRGHLSKFCASFRKPAPTSPTTREELSDELPGAARCSKRLRTSHHQKCTMYVSNCRHYKQPAITVGTYNRM